jgi:hypothetical protein
MTLQLGFVPASSTVTFLFGTYAADGSSVAPLSAFEAADVRIYKDGSATQRTSTSGWTMTSPFDSMTGIHQLSIDLSDNTDAGFYAAGSVYEVVLFPDTETIDGKTVFAVIARFTIGVQAANVTQFGGSAGTFASGVPEVNTTKFGGSTLTQASGIPEVKVASIANNAVTAAAIATDAIDADALKADAVTEIAAGILATALADVYAANGVAPTLQQAVMAIHQMLMAFEIVSTEIRVKKLDGSSSAFNVTLDDAVAPTEAIRS